MSLDFSSSSLNKNIKSILGSITCERSFISFQINYSIKVNRPYLWQYRNLSGCPNVKYENIEQKTSCGYLNATLKNSLPTMLHKVQTASINCGSMFMIYQIKSDGV